MRDCNERRAEIIRILIARRSEAYVVNSLVTCQSRDIAMGVDRGGAGDQGLMFGYATNETPELLPLPFAVATRALELLRDRHSPLLLPDAKSQVTFDYCSRRIHTFLISTQHQRRVHLGEEQPRAGTLALPVAA